MVTSQNGPRRKMDDRGQKSTEVDDGHPTDFGSKVDGHWTKSERSQNTKCSNQPINPKDFLVFGIWHVHFCKIFYVRSFLTSMGRPLSRMTVYFRLASGFSLVSNPFFLNQKIWNWKICEFGVFALFKPNQISKLIHVLNYGWHLKTLFLELKIFSRLWVKTERLEQEIKNFDLFWNQLVQYIIIENLKGMKFFVTFWISDHATRFGNGYNMKYILYIICKLLYKSGGRILLIWCTFGSVLD